ncbi:hypothetical protein [Nocardiopsis sp. CNT312]|uniref:hypothetical protein n=1 Tax=Nocardiopsis sp. CNT312 TaxID=1137268 RepID=UPI00048B89A1|nr:hypothetical protein [Nocardiopsis sp. CNT312]
MNTDVVVFDTGALTALERRQARMWRLVQRVVRERLRIIVPAGVLAQAWRGDARQHAISRLIKGRTTLIDPLNKETARQVGVLLGRSGGSDVVDGHVALLGAKFRAPVLPSDPDDIGKIDPALTIVCV